jgi:hypothetical protein
VTTPTVEDLIPGRRMIWRGRGRRTGGSIPCEIESVQRDMLDGPPMVSIVTEHGRRVDVYAGELTLLGPRKRGPA